MIFLINTNWGISAFLQNKVSVVVLFFFLAAGGSLLRLGFQNSGRWSKPAGTFVANIIASFLLGVLLGGSPSAESVTIIGTGFLGSFSTFSTVMMEVSDEVEGNRKLIATLYLCLSIIAGVAAAFLGLEVGAQ